MGVPENKTLGTLRNKYRLHVVFVSCESNQMWRHLNNALLSIPDCTIPSWIYRVRHVVRSFVTRVVRVIAEYKAASFFFFLPSVLLT